MNKLLVVGGSGALGRSIVHTFKKSTTLTWDVLNIDFSKNTTADKNYVIIDNLSSNEIENINQSIIESNENNGDVKFDCLINVAGGWVGGTIHDTSIVDSVRQMTNMNLLSSVLTAHLATKHLKSDSLLVFTGANVVKNQHCPFMLGYDLSKSSTHRMIDMLVEDSTSSIASESTSSSYLPPKTKIISILPNTIDTENNRKAMPNEDFTKWTKPDDISTLIKDWAEKTKDYPTGTYFEV